MGTQTGGLLLRRGTAAQRWLSTSEALAMERQSNLKKENDKPATVLFRRLSALGLRGGETTTVSDVLNEWKSEGHPLPRPQLLAYVTQLRRFNNHHIALQLYQWMEETKRTLNNSDRAIRIDLLAKTEGVASAEKYFNSLVESAKTRKTYGSLLNCYCHGQMVEKATKLFQIMKELDFHTNALNYNNMMALYMKVGMPEKVPLMVQEMEDKGIALDLYSYNQLMNSYAAHQDIDAVEEVWKTMRRKKVKYDWFTLGNLATIYYNAGLEDKAKTTLKDLEKRKMPGDPEAFHTLINLYSHMSAPAEVNRVWELCKSKLSKINNVGYLIMHLALSRLNDYEGLEKLFREWESVCSNYDIRISNVMLESYLKRDMIEEAGLLYDSIIKRGAHPNLRTHNAYINLCLKKHEIDFALQHFEMCAYGVNSKRHRWFPPQETVDAFLRYFNEERDSDAANKFQELMKKNNRVIADTEE